LQVYDDPRVLRSLKATSWHGIAGTPENADSNSIVDFVHRVFGPYQRVIHLKIQYGRHENLENWLVVSRSHGYGRHQNAEKHTHENSGGNLTEMDRRARTFSSVGSSAAEAIHVLPKRKA
jgi:hypothetical protein